MLQPSKLQIAKTNPTPPLLRCHQALPRLRYYTRHSSRNLHLVLRKANLPLSNSKGLPACSPFERTITKLRAMASTGRGKPGRAEQRGAIPAETASMSITGLVALLLHSFRTRERPHPVKLGHGSFNSRHGGLQSVPLGIKSEVVYTLCLMPNTKLATVSSKTIVCANLSSLVHTRIDAEKWDIRSDHALEIAGRPATELPQPAN